MENAIIIVTTSNAVSKNPKNKNNENENHH